MKKSLYSLLLVCFYLVYTHQLFAFTTTVSAANLQKTNSGSMHYIDISIHQPNIEECYNTSAPLSKWDNQWMRIYPNPNPGVFMLELSMEQAGLPVEIGIFDLTGKRVMYFSEYITDHQITKEINVSFLNKGVYFIRVTGKENSGVKQIVIN